MNALLHLLDETRVSARDEARAILRTFRGALASMSPRDRANIAAQSEEENIGYRRPGESD
jgi:hypothetical protein